MTKKTFTKILSANDVGATATHQGGILVPKAERELLAFFPQLDSAIKNPDTWIECIDEEGARRKLRFIYYNNKLHDEGGTRNEYRITHLTRYFRGMGACEGDVFEISRDRDDIYYAIRVVRPDPDPTLRQDEQGFRIKITTGWRRIH